MNLTVDIGNTQCHLSLFDGDECVASESFNSLTPERIADFAGGNTISGVIICSVKEADDSLERMLKEKFGKVITLDYQTPVPVTNAYASPETLGMDRLAAVVGAWKMYPGSPCLVIDAGTAITYDFIDASGVYRGGNIAPGATLRLRSLSEHTGRLPLVSLNERRRNTLMGDNTRAAILGGVVNGIAFEIEGYIGCLAEKNDGLKVLFTGGDAFFFEKYIKSSIFVVSNLTAVGLNAILNFNLN